MRDAILATGIKVPFVSLAILREQSGGIVGRARIVDVIAPGGNRLSPGTGRHPMAEDPWYAGEFGFVLADVEPVAFRPWRGALGLFDVPE